MWDPYKKGYKAWLRLEKSLSDNSVEAYLRDVEKLTNYLQLHNILVSPTELKLKNLQQFVKWIGELGMTATSQARIISGIRGFYKYCLVEQITKIDPSTLLEAPKTSRKLPDVLTFEEIELVIAQLDQSKPDGVRNKAILETLYSCGLRVSEVCKLKVSDIDSERMQVFIERSKGKKDRYVTLSPVLLDILRQYMKMHKPMPKRYLFEGQKENDPYSTRSAQTVFNRAVKTAGIHKSVTFHVLRHSFATHLWEKGVDIKYIKELLGHFDIKTTERYLHVVREKLVQIRSPLDYLDTGI